MNILGAFQKYLIGPIRIFQQYDPTNNIHSLSTGNHPLIPNFGLPPGWTWAQLPSTAGYSNIGSECQDVVPAAEVTDENEKPAERIPRPPNPFIIYRAAHHKTVADAHPEASNNEICESTFLSYVLISERFTTVKTDNSTAKMIGRQWQNEKEEVRDTYRAKAAEIKAAFMAVHPDYKYSPRKSCEVKRRAKKTISPITGSSDAANQLEA